MIEITLKDLIILLVVGLIFFILLVVFIFKKFTSRKKLIGLDPFFVQEKWKKINSLIKKGGENNLKIALIEADNLFDSVLKSMGFGGNSLGERLKVASYRYPELKKIWEAHKIRNQIVHEPEFELNLKKAKKALEIFKKGLKNLGAI